MSGPTQPEPAEGPRTDDPVEAEKGRGQGVSAEEPAEGADTDPGDGSPRG